MIGIRKNRLFKTETSKIELNSQKDILLIDDNARENRFLVQLSLVLTSLSMLGIFSRKDYTTLTYRAIGVAVVSLIAFIILFFRETTQSSIQLKNIKCITARASLAPTITIKLNNGKVRRLLTYNKEAYDYVLGQLEELDIEIK